MSLFDWIDGLFKEKKVFDEYWTDELFKCLSNIEKVKWCITNGADVNAKKKDRSALMIASEGYLAKIVKCLIENGADVNAKDYYSGWTALIGAMCSPIICLDDGKLETVKYLVANGADVNAKDGLALMKASSDGYLEIVKCLVANGANVNAKDNLGHTALMLAALYGHLEVVKYLIANGADVNATDNQGRTAGSFDNEINEILANARNARNRF